MEFSWSEAQLAEQQSVVRFAQEELNQGVSDREQNNEFSREDWNKCAEFGVLGWIVPDPYGGSGKDILTTILLLEGLGYGCRDNGLPFALNAHIWSFQKALLEFGSETQKAMILPPVCRGELIGSFGITEEEIGSDTYAMQATAERVDGGYLLNGRKSYVTLAPVADMALVFATVDATLGRWGITGFLVKRGVEGFDITPTRDKMGLRTTPMGDLLLEDCFVPTDARLGAEGAGMSLFATAMEAERGYIFASQIGAMQRQLDEGVAYARQRKTFGQPIGRFQSVSNRIADMKLRLELARLLIYKVAWLEQQGRSALMEAAMAKLYLSETFVESSLDSIRLHGAKGYVTEYEIERDLRDAVGGLIYSGTSDIQRNIIARMLGL